MGERERETQREREREREREKKKKEREGGREGGRREEGDGKGQSEFCMYLCRCLPVWRFLTYLFVFLVVGFLFLRVYVSLGPYFL